jgi:hypothetical protein
MNRHTLFSTWPALATAVIALLLGGLCGACTSSSGSWIEREVATGNESLLVTTIQHTLHERGFTVSGGLDTGKRRVESRWNEQRDPFHGWRTRAILEWEPIGGNAFSVRVRVESEENKSERPLDRKYDKWRSLPDEPSTATGVMLTLKMRMRDYKIEVNDPDELFDPAARN